ncbi:MAG: hypothetical protein R3229_16460 [Alphaproteobacteria bacterium]|nr:hypothetical protein [Alphaproteobacteria bacterium]
MLPPELIARLKARAADPATRSDAPVPGERAEMGLPEEGWEEELFGHLGIDLGKL